MSLKKNKTGSNMYPWIDAMHTHLAGECKHGCKYCYVKTGMQKNNPRFTGPISLVEDEFKVNYGTGKVIFIEHCQDLFAKEVPTKYIDRILKHCADWPDNTYVFQTKNPLRIVLGNWIFPPKYIIGTTIETNRIIPGISNAPTPAERMASMLRLDSSLGTKVRKFVTIEPVLDFDVDILANWIVEINPEFLNLGADSKKNDLPEPTVEKVMALVARLHESGIELREKHNLQRLKAK